MALANVSSSPLFILTIVASINRPCPLIHNPSESQVLDKVMKHFHTVPAFSV